MPLVYGIFFSLCHGLASLVPGLRGCLPSLLCPRLIFLSFCVAGAKNMGFSSRFTFNIGKLGLARIEGPMITDTIIQDRGTRGLQLLELGSSGSALQPHHIARIAKWSTAIKEATTSCILDLPDAREARRKRGLRNSEASARRPMIHQVGSTAAVRSR